MDKRITPDICAAARESMAETGIPASITVSQWALESGYGAHVSGKNNCFGIKATAGQACTTRITHECVGGKWETLPQHFADYPTLALGFAAHAHLLATGAPYASARRLLPDAAKFGAAMAKRYATDPNYWAKLLSIITANDLFALDAPVKLVAAAKAEVVTYLCKGCGRSDTEARERGCGRTPDVNNAGSPPSCPMEAVITSARVAAAPPAAEAVQTPPVVVGPTTAPAAISRSTGLLAHLLAWWRGRAAS